MEYGNSDVQKRIEGEDKNYLATGDLGFIHVFDFYFFYVLSSLVER